MEYHGGGPFVVDVPLPDGGRYAREGMQFLRLRWGRVVEDRPYEDTEVLVAALQVIAAHGRPEASAAPLGPVVAPGLAADLGPGPG